MAEHVLVHTTICKKERPHRLSDEICTLCAIRSTRFHKAGSLRHSSLEYGQAHFVSSVSEAVVIDGLLAAQGLCISQPQHGFAGNGAASLYLCPICAP